MFFPRRSIGMGAVVALGAALSGCVEGPLAIPCMNAGEVSDLVRSTALARVSLYVPGTTCEENGTAVGVPVSSRSFVQGEKFSLDIPPGRHTVVLATFSDAAGTVPLGVGCVDTDVLPGQKVCLGLTLKKAPSSQSCMTDADCDVDRSNGTTCSGGACGYTGCRLGYGNCDATAPDRDGCETPTNTTNNCGGCGNVCDTLSSVGAVCAGTTCTYSACQPGRIDCNMTSPDLNGCECETNPANPMCCPGGGCQVKHDTGLNPGVGASLHWFDCTPRDTWDLPQAISACNAFVGSRTGWACNDVNCGSQRLAVCAEQATCTSEGSPCWGYQGVKGHAYYDPTCMACVGAADPFWH